VTDRVERPNRACRDPPQTMAPGAAHASIEPDKAQCPQST